MEDYINYIDFNALKLANLAIEIGDYGFAIENYTKALNRLRNYQGDRMQPAMMTSEFIEKINELKSKPGKSVLKFELWKLTKSSFVKGNQCSKHLYLDKYKKHEKTPVSKEKQERFDQGHAFEELVREKEFPGGLNIKEKVGNFAYFNSYTRHVIDSSGNQTIYEATIIEEEVLVMCDILVKEKNGSIHIYETKKSTELNDAIIADLAVQYAICKKRFASNLKSFNLVLRVEGEPTSWKIINQTDNLEKQIDKTIEKIKECKAILEKGEPVVEMGEHCNKPYECDFIQYCKKLLIPL